MIGGARPSLQLPAQRGSSFRAVALGSGLEFLGLCPHTGPCRGQGGGWQAPLVWIRNHQDLARCLASWYLFHVPLYRPWGRVWGQETRQGVAINNMDGRTDGAPLWTDEVKGG